MSLLENPANIKEMPAKSDLLTPKPPKIRPLGIHDAAWAFPGLLAEHGNARGLTQKTLAAKAGVTQSTISRWLHYKGLQRPDAAKILRIEEALGLQSGTLLPQAEAEEVLAFKKRATDLGFPPTLLAALSDNHVGERMQALRKEVRQAILGIVHVYDVTVEQATAAAMRAWDLEDPKLRERQKPPYWFQTIVRELPSRTESGTHLRLEKK